MSSERNIINKTASAQSISLNTPIIFELNSGAIDKFINDPSLDPTGFFSEREAFTYIALENAATDTITVVLEQITNKGTFTTTFTMRVGAFRPCRGTRILTGTDISGIFTVGVGG